MRWISDLGFRPTWDVYEVSDLQKRFKQGSVTVESMAGHTNDMKLTQQFFQHCVAANIAVGDKVGAADEIIKELRGLMANEVRSVPTLQIFRIPMFRWRNPGVARLSGPGQTQGRRSLSTPSFPSFPSAWNVYWSGRVALRLRSWASRLP